MHTAVFTERFENIFEPSLALSEILLCHTVSKNDDDA